MSKSTKKRAAASSSKLVAAAKAMTLPGEAKPKKRAAAVPALPRPTAKSGQESANDAKTKNPDSGSKQSRVLALLRSPAGATIAAMMQATGWQQHSVRGFLAGVVRKRLKLKLISKKLDGSRVYRISGGADAKAKVQDPKRAA